MECPGLALVVASTALSVVSTTAIKSAGEHHHVVSTNDLATAVRNVSGVSLIDTPKKSFTAIFLVDLAAGEVSTFFVVEPSFVGGYPGPVNYC